MTVINTIDYDKIPATVLHRITGEIDVEEVRSRMGQTCKIVDSAVRKHGKFNLIIDSRGLKFTDEAHTLWKQKIEDEPRFKEKMNYLVFVLDYSAKARAAKKRRENEITRFFYDFDEGIHWLRNHVIPEKKA